MTPDVPGISLRPLVTGSAATLVISRLQSSLRAYLALMLRPASWLALLTRTFTFELSLTGSPRANVEYDYVGKQSIPTTGLSPASPTALWAAEPGLTQPACRPVFLGGITSFIWLDVLSYHVSERIPWIDLQWTYLERACQRQSNSIPMEQMCRTQGQLI